MTRNETENPAPARQRIAKLMARVGLCSRRDAEAWIVEGRVSVNGEVLTSPALDVSPDDTILVDGAPLPQAEKTRLFLFHKPRGLVTSDHDPEGRATVADHLREHWPDGPRVVTIGRLDINTEGLLLLTNDGGLARLLELPKTGWVRRYRVRAKGETDQSVLDGLADGITIDGIDYAGIEAKLDRQQGANVWLTMGLREGKNREVKRVLEAIGLEVNRLIRLSFGPFQLGDLPEGAVEEVRTRVLRDQLGPTLAEAAGARFEEAPAPVERKPARPDRAPARSAGGERAEKVTRLSPGGRRDERPRGGDRPLARPLRGERESEAPAPIRERPKAGTRKHVSTLRAEETEATRRGPRKRIERGDLTDRRDRKVTVERLVGAHPIEPTRARDGGRPARRDDPRAAPGKPARRGASPSALAKRARAARSGGAPGEERRHRDDAAPPRRRERPDGAPRPDGATRPAPAGGREERRDRFDAKPRAAGGRGRKDDRRRAGSSGPGASRSDARSSRRGDERTGARPARGERPDRRDGSARGEARRDGSRFEGKRTERSPAPRGDGAPRPDKRRSTRGTEQGERRSAPGERPGGRPPSRSGGKPAGGRPAGARPAGGKPGGGNPTGGRPTGGKPAGGKPRGPAGGGRGKPRPKA